KHDECKRTDNVDPAFQPKEWRQCERRATLDRLGDDRWCGRRFRLPYTKHAGQEKLFNFTLLSDALDLIQHWRAPKICFTCDHYPVRADTVYRKLADNRFEFVRRSKYLHP